MRLLTLTLKQKALQELFKPAKFFGRRDRGTWTYAIEEVNLPMTRRRGEGFQSMFPLEGGDGEEHCETTH